MSIVFKPKIGEHLRKSPRSRSDGYSVKDIQELIQLRVKGLTHKQCGDKLDRTMGSIGTALRHYKLQPAIDKARAALFEAKTSPCVGVCKLNDALVCTGCDRTLDEIANWT